MYILFNKNIRYSFLCIAFFTSAYLMNIQPLAAQKIAVSLSRNTILIGEQVSLQLQLEMQDPPAFQLLSWTVFSDSSNHVTVVKQEDMDSSSTNGHMLYTQHIILTSFDSGNWKLAPLKVELKNSTSRKTIVLVADSILLQVLPVDISGMKNYHDIKDIMEVKVNPPYIKYALIALFGFATVVILFLLWKKLKKKKVPSLSPTIKKHPFEQAMEQFEKLKKENPQTYPEIKTFYTQLTSICKKYITSVLPVHAVHLTTDEMIVRLTAHLADEKLRIQFFQLLRFADAIKFAKYFPPNPEKDHSLSTAIQLITYIDAHTQKPIQ